MECDEEVLVEEFDFRFLKIDPIRSQIRDHGIGVKSANRWLWGSGNPKPVSPAICLAQFRKRDLYDPNALTYLPGP
jgi:hypothetical protein